MTLFPTGGEHDFNPRSHEGSDRRFCESHLHQGDFNPRSHEGSDQSGEIRDNWYTEISIHAPTRGATRPLVKGILRHLISIHAPTRGATVTLGIYTRGLNISIHAPTRGATGWKSAKGNPVKFQSTLPRGERLWIELGFCGGTIFQSTLPRGERHLRRWSGLQEDYFNPRSHEGSDSWW